MIRFRFLILALALASDGLSQSTGSSFCNVANNSTGMPTALTGSFGSGGGSDLHLEVNLGVPGELGYFLVGNEATSGVVISNGLNCLIGTGTAQMFRYNVAGGVSNSVGRFDNAGVFQNLVGTSLTGSGFDVPVTIPGATPIMILSGDTWHFQLWHRDTPAALGSSNFSNGLSVTFPPPGSVPIAGMVRIPAGMFDMGSEGTSAPTFFGPVGPVHSVTISQSFWMSETEITQDQYQALMGSNPSHFTGPNLPVEQVTWQEARAFCAALTAQEQAAGNVSSGMEYRLPTEAEWEYACRAGTQTEYSVGIGLLCSQAKFWFSYFEASSCNSNSTMGVGSYAHNAFGLYDMHGNVWEWCLDSYAGYSAAAVTDPLVTGSSVRILRGGSWGSYALLCRSAYRSAGPSDTSLQSIGFRVVLAGVLVP